MTGLQAKAQLLRHWSILAAVAAGLGGCAESPKKMGAGFETIQLERTQSAATQAAQQGLNAMAQGDLAAANRAFSIALQSDPRSAPLNHMNALAYHLRVRAGDKAYAELAETGYIAALDQRRDFTAAGLQLGHLYYETGRYAAAQRVATHVLDIESDNAEALRLLAAASYNDGDFELALWAVERARAMGAPNVAGAPLVYAAVGLPASSQAGFGTAALSEPSNSTLERRISQWQAHRETLLAQGVPVLDLNAPPPFIKGPPQAGANITAPSAAGPGATPPGLTGPGMVLPGTSGLGTAAGTGPVEPAWYDCQQAINPLAATTDGFATLQGYGTQTGDETVALPALPAPCRGRAMPRMAVIDAVLVRSDDVSSEGFGVNLLDNLNVFVSRSLNQSRGTNGSTGRMGSIADVLSLGTSSAGGIVYSLNIANATDQSADIIARPSLLALDRQPAQFFSGSSVSVALVSTQGGGTINDKPVGVSLSVTPTFIDDESMLVSVKAARSFFETTAPTATFEQSVQTSRNVVSANVRMRFNETLILSGLSEREITSTTSGVPVLRDIPGVQYLFQRRSARDFTKSVIILLTPRRVSNFDTSLSEANKSIAENGTAEPAVLQATRAQALKDLGGLWPNHLLALRNMDRNKLFRGVRTGDMGAEAWDEPTRLRRMFEDAARLIAR